MRLLLRVLLLSAALLLAAAPFAAAAGPQTMSYQGVLTDGGGNLVPDGNYNLTFRIHSAPAAGTLLWTEVHNNVPVAKGGFSVILGSTNPITVPFTAQRYLGIQVGANPELTPRVTLAGAPNSMGVTMRGSGPSEVGEVGWFPSLGGGYGDGGGFLHFRSEANGSYQFVLEPDFDGDGGYMWVGGATFSGLIWDGNSGGGGSLQVGGTPSSFSLNTGLTGDNAAVFPDNSIASAEILDEPGIASGFSPSFTLIGTAGNASTTDLISVTINTPAPGYVVLTGNFQVNLLNDANTQAIYYQITETSGAGIDDYQYAGQSTAHFPGWLPCSAHRTYYKPAAGAYTFYLQASNWSGTGAYSFHPRLTAIYVPTAYGTVTTTVSELQAAEFEHATPVAASPDAAQPSGGGMVVDLRELELRVRREEARLQEARLQLQQAQVRQQQEARARAGAVGAAVPASPAPKEER